MQIFNVSTLCMQKLWYKLNFLVCTHYLITQNPYEEEKWKNCKVQNAVILSKHYFLGTKYLHANVKCLSIVYTKYQNVPEIDMGVVEFLIQALSKRYVELRMAVTVKDLNLSP